MATRHADIDAREAGHYFRESIACLVETHKAQVCVPDWIPLVEALMTMERF